MSGIKDILPNCHASLKAFARTMSQYALSEPTNPTTKMWNAVVNGALDNNRPDFHPVKDEDNNILFYESLSRPIDNNGVSQAIYPLVNEYYDHHQHYDLDLCTCFTAMEVAEINNLKPISLNISVASALNPHFFDFIETDLKTFGFKPEDIIFEILEHPVDRDANIEHLEKLKAKGCRFALDDFGIEKKFQDHLHVFGDLVDFIKVDGQPYVRDYLDKVNCDETAPSSDKCDLIKILIDINRHYGTNKIPSLIAEHVHNRQEIPILKKLGFVGFQGEYTKKWDPAKSLDDPLANPSDACDYENAL